MKVLKATEARANLYKLIDKVKDESEPVQIVGKRSSAILVSENDWASMQETLYLLSIPGMRESLLEAKEEPLSESLEEIEW